MFYTRVNLFAKAVVQTASSTTRQVHMNVKRSSTVLKSKLPSSLSLPIASFPLCSKQIHRGLMSAGAEATKIESYNGLMKVFHWVGALSILGAIATVKVCQNTAPKTQTLGLGKAQWMFYHKSCGLLMAMTIFPRIGIRMMSNIPKHLPSSPAVLADAAHYGMYFTALGMSITGVAMGYLGGKGLPFFYTTFPGAEGEKKNGKMAGDAFKIHSFMGKYVLEPLVCLHIGAVGFHIAKGEAVIARMLA